MMKANLQAGILLFVLAVVGSVIHGQPGAPGAGGHAGPAATAPATVEVRGLALVARAGDAGNDTFGSYAGIAAGTMVSLRINRPAGGLLAFDLSATSLTKIADDKGTNLLTQLDVGRHSALSGIQYPQIGKEGTAAALAFVAPGLPAKGAREIALEGVVAFRIATQQKTVEQKSVAVKEGSSFAVGPLELKVSRAVRFHPPPAAVTRNPRTPLLQLIAFTAPQNLGDIVAVKFYDDAGKEIESAPDRSVIVDVGSVTERTYHLAQFVDTVTMKVTYWSDAQTIKVPIDLKVGLGL